MAQERPLYLRRLGIPAFRTASRAEIMAEAHPWELTAFPDARPPRRRYLNVVSHYVQLGRAIRRAEAFKN